MRIPNNYRLAIAAAFALMVVAAATYFFFFSNKSREIENPVDKILRFTYTLTNTSADFIEAATFESYLPLEINGSQTIKNIVSSHEYELLHQAGIANSIQYKVENLAPYSSRIISVTIELQRSANHHQESIKKKLYLKNEKYIERDSEAVRTLAASLENNEFWQKSAYEWLANNIQDAGYVAENKGAEYALQHRAGDCTEHMYAFVALARANGIPARGVAGFVVNKAADILDSSKYHNWAEYYDGKKWILVDSQKRIFDAHYEHYIPYRFFGAETETRTSANRFLITDKRISIQF